ncbi:1-acyl-sn-glycerol-3-phosphate acyltransferase [Marinicella sp. S1101]|uniref:1-acyl-sn-glycerol-3-phosphate acyltransferase n=1 Tax=Marinicella marina TaxID=2996016 RepID=UPI002261024F|nr:1-acyl-sn-glycerol-3-phosphate acyltransferase [Marinicella marina]MCX7553663.1 1-acyl-sn-glycerol-3-phosphate acyltransferase [Marinicella marina]MDJ1140287.1 1-acyl-sn-glycerol-3-phosphate acyltransferase [Marinicella marina]
MNKKKPLEIRDKTIFDGIIVKYILKFIFKIWFKLTGWKAIESGHQGAGITIAAPHTSNWDVVYAMGAAILLDIKIYFSIKESWCRIPVIGRLMMWMGAIPITRKAGSQGQIGKITRFVDKHKQDRIFFLFTAEGTRGKVEKWKTGFYHLAEGTDLPIFLAKVDFRTKESGVFHTYHLTGNKEDDIRSIQESYKKVRAKFPELQYPEYTGPMPELSDMEARILRTVYSAKGVATRLEIAAKLKAQQLSTAMLEFLVEKGVLEKTGSDNAEPEYKLTFAGKGCLLHLYPALNQEPAAS